MTVPGFDSQDNEREGRGFINEQGRGCQSQVLTTHTEARPE